MTDSSNCPDCGASFQSQDALGQHKASKHYAKPNRPHPAKAALKAHKKLAVLAVLVVIAGGILYVFSQGVSATGAVAFPPKLSNQPMHTHPVLEIFVDGRPIAIEANIGIGRIHQPIHTHEPDGVIHVESPDTRDYVLGNFFSIWGKRFDGQCVGEYCGTVEMTVDGKANAEFASHVLRDRERIVLNVSTNAGETKGAGA